MKKEPHGGWMTAMKEDYTDIIQQVSQVVFEAIKDREENLSTGAKVAFHLA